MRKIYFMIAMLLLGSVAMAQNVFEEDFQGGVIPASFTLINDANTVASGVASLFPDAWNVLSEPADTANKVAASTSWFTAPVAADRWMITPAITVAAGNMLMWRGKAQDPDYPDGYAVKISTTGTNKADFTVDAFSVSSETVVWSNHSYDLTSLVGQTIYVAFIQNSTDQFYIMIDDIKVGLPSGIEEAAATSVVRVYPNPASDFVKISATSAIQTVKVMNAVGQVVMEQVANQAEVTIDITSLTSGVYFITGTTENGTTFTEKVMVR